MYFATPYILEPPPPDQPYKPLTTKLTNYQDYDIFALRINLKPIIDEIDPSLTYELEQHEMTFMTEQQGSNEGDDLRTQWFVKIAKPNEFVEANILADNDTVEKISEERVFLTDSQIAQLQESIVNVCNPTELNVLFVMSYQADVRSQSGKKINKAWVTAMIPFAPFDFIRPIYHKTRGVYIIMDRNTNYEFVYENFQNSVVNWLQSQYELGVLPMVVSEDFLNDWNLRVHKRFVVPITKNHFIMGDDVVDFYLNKIKTVPNLAGTGSINESGTKNKYIWMSPEFFPPIEKSVFSGILEQNELNYRLEQNTFLVEVRNYTQLQSVFALYQVQLDLALIGVRNGKKCAKQ